MLPMISHDTMMNI